jgi:hypothetical protein
LRITAAVIASREAAKQSGEQSQYISGLLANTFAMRSAAAE